MIFELCIALNTEIVYKLYEIVVWRVFILENPAVNLPNVLRNKTLANNYPLSVA